jgi:hypothetical protein
MDQREALLADLAEAHAAFHALLDSLTDADWRQPSRNPGWTNGEVLFHMAFGFIILAALAPLVRFWGRVPRRYSKRFASLLNSATGLFNRVNALGARGGRRIYTRRRLGRKFDRTYAAIVRLVATAKADEWSLGMHYPTRWDGLFHDYMTLEDICRYPIAHFRFHLHQIAAPSPPSWIDVALY